MLLYEVFFYLKTKMAKKEKTGQARGYKPRFSFIKTKEDSIRDVTLRAGAWGAASAASLVSQSGASDMVRNIIPEPFDLMDHAGNLAPSMVVGVGVTYLSALLGTKFSNTPKAVRRFAMAIGGTAVVAANLLVETKYGLNIYSAVNNNTTPDVLDIAYGVGAGVLASSLVSIVPVEDGKEMQSKGDDRPLRIDSVPVWHS